MGERVEADELDERGEGVCFISPCSFKSVTIYGGADGIVVSLPTM